MQHVRASSGRGRHARILHSAGLLLLGTLGACAESATIASDEESFLDLTRAQIAAVSGASQEGEVGAFLPEPLTVEVRSHGGIPMAGVMVEWTFQAGQGVTTGSGSSGTATSLISRTDSDGRTTAAWLLGPEAGPQESAAQILIPSTAPQGAGAGVPGYGKGNKVGFSARARPGAVSTIEVSPAHASLRPGETLQASAEARDSHGNLVPGKTPYWSVSDAEVLQVDVGGLVTALAGGTADVRATIDGVTGSRPVTVAASGTGLPAGTYLAVDPAAVSFSALGDTTVLSAAVRDAEGRPLDGYAFTFETTDPAVVEADAMGVLTAKGVGLAAVVVTTVCCTVSDTVAVEVRQVPAGITVSRISLSLSAGDTAHVSALVTDANGNSMDGTGVNWTSQDPAVALVQGTGDGRAVVTAVAGGATTLRAAVGGVAAEMQVTVQAGGPPSSLANECASPGQGWVWCDDFEADRMASYFEYADAEGSFARASSVGVEGSSGMRARFAAGQVSAGGLHLALGRTPQSYFRAVDAGTRDYRELYWRVFVRNQPGWTGGGGDKLSRAFIFASPSSWAQAMIAHVWSGSGDGANHLVIDPASGTDESGTLVTTTYNDFANLRWLGAARSGTPLFDPSHVGEWQCVEARVRLNDAGQSNGVFQLWINGSLEAERTGLNWVGAFDDYGLNAVYLENYWNAGSPVAQERYLDNFVVSTTPIGCGAA